MADTPKPPQSPPSRAGRNHPQREGRQSAYSNFARVTSTAEEVDHRLLPQPQPVRHGRTEISVSQRLIMNFYTAKRLFSALG